MTSSAAISSMHVMMRGPMRFTAGAKRSSGLFLFASYNGEFLFRCAVGSLVNTDRLAGWRNAVETSSKQLTRHFLCDDHF